MDTIEIGFTLAGFVQLMIASANLFAPHVFRYRENLARLSPIVREIFIVHSVYIVLVVVAFAFLCFLFPQDLAGGSSLGRFLSRFLALFWALRLSIQLWVYDSQIKKEHPVFARLFALAFFYLTAIFAYAVWRA